MRQILEQKSTRAQLGFPLHVRRAPVPMPTCLITYRSWGKSASGGFVRYFVCTGLFLSAASLAACALYMFATLVAQPASDSDSMSRDRSRMVSFPAFGGDIL